MEEIRNIVKKMIKVMVQILFIFLMPFVLPIISKILVNVRFFENPDELKSFLEMFNGLYTYIYLGIGALLLVLTFYKWDNIKEFLKDRDFLINLKDKIISSNKASSEELNRADEQKKFIDKITEENKTEDSNITINEMKSQLGMLKLNTNNSCQNCNIEDLEKENIKLRDFATYNIINYETRSLLHVMYNENYIELDTFKSRIIQGYKKRNKRNKKFSQKDVNKIAKNKYESIFDGLKFLNIIEPSEDDKILKLTKEGKAYVEKYIEQKDEVV